MNITVIGTGYVGLVSGACFAHMGNQVCCVDTNEAMIAALNRGILPIYEPGLETLVHESLESGTLTFVTDTESALAACQIAIIAVGTPMDKDGSADLCHVFRAAADIGRFMRRPLVAVTKSTVPVGTTHRVEALIGEELEKRGLRLAYATASNPEFLKEGTAVDDFLHPDRIIVGALDEFAVASLRELYRPFLLNHDRMQVMDPASAEMTKYASNAMLATKISFMNEIASICELVGADINRVRVGIGSDSRIGYSFLYAGAGYGGSCFPKDIRALINTAREHGLNPQILRAVESVNHNQKNVIVQKVLIRFGDDLEGLCFALWGLSFKPDTDDMREAPSLHVVRELTVRGARIQAYDPKAMSEARLRYLGDNRSVKFCESKYEALKNADSLILITEWKEFRSPDFEELSSLLRQKIIFDGRNQYDRRLLAQQGFEYYEIGYDPLHKKAHNAAVLPLAIESDPISDRRSEVQEVNQIA